MTIVGHIWTVVTNLIAVFVILAMFSRASGPFETMVIAGLTLIYIAVTGATAFLSQGQLRTMQASSRHFARIAELLKDEDTQQYYADIEETEALTKKISIRFYINAGFNALFWAIAIINILLVL